MSSISGIFLSGSHSKWNDCHGNCVRMDQNFISRHLQDS